MDEKRIGGVILAFAGVALANEVVVRAGYGVLKFLTDGGPMTFTAMRSAIGLAAMIAGLYFVLRRSTKEEREAQHKTLVDRLLSLSVQLRGEMAGGLGPTHSTLGQIAAAYHGLDRLGIATPAQMGLSKEKAWEHASKFIDGISPLVRDGHIVAARREAREVIRAIGATPARATPLWRRLFPQRFRNVQPNA